MWNFLIFLVVLVFSFVLFLNIATLKYKNPYRLTMIFGKKGSGKSTTLTRLALEARKAGKEVFANIPLPGAHLIKESDIGFFDIPPESVLIVDEAGMIWDNRHFKNFKPEVRDWFKLQRHHRVRVYLASQTFDIDKKIRDLCDDMYLVECRFRIFAYGRRILRKITLTKPIGDAEAKITEELSFDSILFCWAGSRLCTLIPRYAGVFDSFQVQRLPQPKTPYPVCASGAPLPSRGFVWVHLIKDFCDNIHLSVAGAFGKRKLKQLEKYWDSEEMPTKQEIEDSMNQSIEDFFASRPK